MEAPGFSDWPHPSQCEQGFAQRRFGERRILRVDEQLVPQCHQSALDLGGALDRALSVLKEAQVWRAGNQLGPVGGRIVAEVLLGLLRADLCSYLTVRPSWTPTLPHFDGASFGLADLLLFAADAAAR